MIVEQVNAMDATAHAPGMVGGEAAPVGSHSPAGAPQSANPWLNDADPEVRRAAQMLSGRDRAASIPDKPAPDTDPSARLLELEHLKKHDFVRYDSLGLAEEHAALLESRAGEAPRVEMLSPDVSRQVFEATEGGHELAAEWGSEFGENLQTAQRGASAILADLGDQGNQAAFLGGFYSKLPGRAQIAVANELASPAPADLQPVSPEVVHSFSQSGEGEELVGEWGQDASLRISTLRARIARTLGAMPADEAAKTLDWFDGLSSFEAKAVIRHLAR